VKSAKARCYTTTGKHAMSGIKKEGVSAPQPATAALKQQKRGGVFFESA
jgi:hypothetical protein